MNITPDDFAVFRKKMLETKAEEYKRTPPEHMFVEYFLWKLRDIQDLTEIIEKGKRFGKSMASVVAAIKVRGDMYDRIVEKGQEFGVLRKSPDVKVTVGGVLVKDMTNGDLRSKITGALSNLDQLMKKYGDHDMTQVDPGELHHGPKLLTVEAKDVKDVVEAPPSKEEITAPPAKEKFLAKPSRAIKESKIKGGTKGKTSKAASKHHTKAVRGNRTHAIREEIAASKWDGWGD